MFRGRALIAWTSAACVPLTGAFYLWCRWFARRMEDAGQGFGMAFYFSPLAFQAMEAILSLGTALGVFGALAGPRASHRVIALIAAAACFAWFVHLPWR